MSYFQNVDLGQPYTSQWFYQPGIGWLWTNQDTFPFIYRAEDSDGESVQVGFTSAKVPLSKIYLFDYGTESWIEQDF